jgi:hypothetical protein
MNHNKIRLLIVASGLICAIQVQAVETQFELALGHDRGGEGIQVGQANPRDYANANEGFMLTVGGAFANDAAKQFETAISIGYKTSDPWAPYGEVSFRAIPLTVMEFYRPADVRLGLGVTYSINPVFTYKPSGPSEDRFIFKLDNAVGVVAQIGWAPISGSRSIDLRYTSIKYGAGNLNQKFDGSGFGVHFSTRF